MKNPIRPGDDAYALDKQAKIEAVDGDLVKLHGEWRHWMNCLYGPHVVERVAEEGNRSE